MSYCRFSSDNYRSDVYVYDSCYGGIDVYVASNRITTVLPPRPNINELPSDEFAHYYNKWLEAVTSAEREPVGGKFDGEYKNFDTADEAIAFLNLLIEDGYHIPEWLIPDIKSFAEFTP